MTTLLLGGVLGGMAAIPADATTLTCTNIAGATSGPLGCGGLTSAVGGGGVLDIAADGNYNNAVVRVQPENQLGSPGTSQDFTAYAVGGIQSGSVGGLGSYVAMFTPNGKIPQFSTTGPNGPWVINSVPAPGATFWAGPNTHCISVVSEFNGPIHNGHHLARWNALLRNCNTNGVFKYGNGVNPGSVTFGFGNAWQEWAPVVGEDGLEMVNVSLFNLHNVEYSLNITGNAGAGTHLIAYPNTSPSLNESWTLIGCTPPASTLDSGSYTACP